MKNNSLFFFAGEQSGDLLGANLLKALKKISLLECYGVGGSLMQQEGLHSIYSMESFQVMGFTSVIASLPRLYTHFQKIKKEILKNKPSAVILIDYPDFNMLLAKALRKNKYQGKIIHYVCPSVWAWRRKRIHSLTKTLDHLLTILPFEKSYFNNTLLPVTYVGHPLISTIDQYTYDQNFYFPHPLLAIFPGSRRQEIELNLPIQLAAAKRLGSKYHLAISVARPELLSLIKNHVDDSILLVPSEKRYELMRSATAALATSGTIILELGLHSTPTVVTYRLATLNYLLGRYAFRIQLPFYSLVNIICQHEVFPEFIHKTLSIEKISSGLKHLIDHSSHCHQECARLRHLLSTQNASERAAQTIQALLLS